jgi:hypothetical protein
MAIVTMAEKLVMSKLRSLVVGGALAACLLSALPATAQQLGPTSTRATTAGQWPASPPRRIYVMPFLMDPALKAELEQAKSKSVIPRGPVRQLLADRPTVVNMVSGNNPDAPLGGVVAKLVADEMAKAGWPVVFWPQPSPPPADGWRLGGQVVLADEGSAAARNIIGFGVGNKHVGIDVGLADPTHAGGQPFWILDSSDRGRLTPGTAAVGAVAGFNPAVIIGKHVASTSGIADISQQKRLADEIAASVAEAINTHPFGR